MRKTIVFFLVVLFAQNLTAQKKIELEKFRCYNVNPTVIDYLKSADIRKKIAAQLNQALQKQLQGSLENTTDLPVELLDFNYVVPVIKPDYKDTDTGRLHLYLDFIEADPYFFFHHADNYLPDSAMLARVKTVFTLEAHLYRSDRKLLRDETLNMAISIAETAGIGNVYNRGIRFADLAVTPKTFIELLRTGTSLLLDPKNDLGLIELKLQPAYHVDNYLLVKSQNRPRVFVSQKKNISTYLMGNTTEMIRMGDPIYEEIRIKGKKAEKYPDDLTAAIKATDNFAKSDYVYLKQEGRDVLRDKNYLLSLTTQVDHTYIPEQENLLFTNFLQGNYHYLFHERDTLARFSIVKRVFDRGNRIFFNLLSNGYDTASVVARPVPVTGSAYSSTIYNYIITGSFSGLPFRIQCSGFDNSIREFFVSNKLICIAQGKFNPEKFVLFDASLSSEFINQLFLIGFNRFLE